jgi:hypothetical protein
MKSDMKNSDAQFEQLYRKAWSAGVEAANAKVPRPMIVGTPKELGGSEIDYSQETFYMSSGVCGFAWVKIRPANGAFAKWLKKTQKVRGISYTGGYDIWISDYNQSYERKQAHANAMAKVLSEAGINAYADGRLD